MFEKLKMSMNVIYTDRIRQSFSILMVKIVYLFRLNFRSVVIGYRIENNKIFQFRVLGRM